MMSRMSLTENNSDMYKYMYKEFKSCNLTYYSEWYGLSTIVSAATLRDKVSS